MTGRKELPRGIDRRSTLNLLAGGAIMIGSGGAAIGEPIVDTTLGRVRGVYGEGHVAFRGIRYARAGRFEPPVAPAPHAGIVDAAAYEAVAPQTNPSPAGPPSVILAFLPRPPGAPPPPKPVEDEDCLFLNVWSPTLDKTRKLPVMVWLHGGFFYSGSGATGEGSVLAARGDVVVVSLNHRLNAFGFSHLDDIGGTDFAHSGNLGMLDIIAALEWVRANIPAFGGDPARVMVFGASGGGMKTAWLLASPRARGLVARAGVQSGPALRLVDRDRATLATERLLAELGLSLARVNDLRRLPVETLLRAYYSVAAANPPARFDDLPGFAPVIDPDLLPHHPFDPQAPDQSRDIPLLIGTNADDMSFFTGNDQAVFDLDEAGALARTRMLIGDRADAAWKLYAAKYPTLTPGGRHLRISSDAQILLPTLIEADRKAAQGGAPVFMYRLDWRSPALGGKLGATHTLESSLLFGQAGAPLLGGRTDAEPVGRRMADAWIAFAATGRPGSDWPAWDSGAKAMHIDDTWSVEPNAFVGERAVLTQG